MNPVNLTAIALTMLKTGMTPAFVIIALGFAAEHEGVYALFQQWAAAPTPDAREETAQALEALLAEQAPVQDLEPVFCDVLFKEEADPRFFRVKTIGMPAHQRHDLMLRDVPALFLDKAADILRKLAAFSVTVTAVTPGDWIKLGASQASPYYAAFFDDMTVVLVATLGETCRHCGRVHARPGDEKEQGEEKKPELSADWEN